MKTILEFNLPEERLELAQALHGLDAILALWNYSNFLRGLLKWDNKGMDEATIEKLRDQLYEIMESYNLNFDELLE